MTDKSMFINTIDTLEITLLTNILILFSSYFGAVDANTLRVYSTKVVIS